MKKLLSIITIVALFFTSSAKAQDFCSTMTKADFVESTKSLKFTTKLNTSHIAGAIKTDPSASAFDAEVKKYINNKFSVTVNGAVKALTFTGSQVKGESVWVYFEANGVSDISSLKIRNSILDVLPKQVNIVNVSYKGTQKNLTFQRGKETAEVSF